MLPDVPGIDQATTDQHIETPNVSQGIEAWRTELLDKHKEAFTKFDVPVMGKDGKPKTSEINLSKRDVNDNRVILCGDLVLRIDDKQLFSPSMRSEISPLEMLDKDGISVNLRSIAQSIESQKTLAGVSYDEALKPDSTRLSVNFYQPDYSKADRHPLADTYPDKPSYKMVDVVHKSTPINEPNTSIRAVEWTLSNLKPEKPI